MSFPTFLTANCLITAVIMALSNLGTMTSTGQLHFAAVNMTGGAVSGALSLIYIAYLLSKMKSTT